MRKYIIGGLCGMAIMMSFNVSAAVESIIGKQVEGTAPVKLNGTNIGKESIIVDGSSYAPVRAIGEALGLDVDFKNNEVVLAQKNKEETSTVSTPENTPSKTVSKEKQLKIIDNQISEVNINIWSMKASLEGKDESYDHYKEFKDRLTKYETELADLEKQKAELQIQK